MSPSSTAASSREFHHSLVVIDALEHSRWDRELFEELRRGGVTAIHVTLAVWEDARATLDTVARWRRHFREYGDLIMPATSAADIELAKARDRTAIIFGFQNASPLEDDLGLVEVFHALDVRIIQLTYNNQSLVGGGCYEKEDGGLTRFGRQVVREMNRLGMLIDLSHCGERTTLDVIDASERPVAITHSHSKAFHNSLRNKSIDLLRALARSGGMLGLSLYPFHIGGAGCTLERYCEGVQHAVEIMGIDQVGFGSDSSRKWTDADLDWIRSGRWTHDVDFGEGSAAQRSWPRWPDWFQTPAYFPVLTEGLLARGFTREEVARALMQQDLRAVGVEVSFERLEWSAFLAKASLGLDDETSALYTGWTTGAQDPYWLERMFGSASAPPRGVNRSWYANPKVDDLLTKGRAEPDDRRRIALYREAAKIIADDAPWIFLYQDRWPRAFSTKVQGFVSAPSPYVDLTKIWLTR